MNGIYRKLPTDEFFYYVDGEVGNQCGTLVLFKDKVVEYLTVLKNGVFVFIKLSLYSQSSTEPNFHANIFVLKHDHID